MLAKTLSQAEALLLDANIDKLSDCKFLSEQEVVELATKCKVGCDASAAVASRGAAIALPGDLVDQGPGGARAAPQAGQPPAPRAPRSRRSCCSRSRM